MEWLKVEKDALNKEMTKSMTLNRIQYRKRIHMANPDWLMMTISLLHFSWIKAYRVEFTKDYVKWNIT